MAGPVVATCVDDREGRVGTPRTAPGEDLLKRRRTRVRFPPPPHDTIERKGTWKDFDGTNAATIAEQLMTRSITSAGLATWKLTPRLPATPGAMPMRLAFVEYEQVNSQSAHRGRVVFAATYVI